VSELWILLQFHLSRMARDNIIKYWNALASRYIETVTSLSTQFATETSIVSGGFMIGKIDWDLVGTYKILLLVETGVVTDAQIEEASARCIKMMEQRGEPCCLLVDLQAVTKFEKMMGMWIPSVKLKRHPLLKLPVAINPRDDFFVANAMKRAVGLNLPGNPITFVNTREEADAYILQQLMSA